jgi:hypothetical protein
MVFNEQNDSIWHYRLRQRDGSEEWPRLSESRPSAAGGGHAAERGAADYASRHGFASGVHATGTWCFSAYGSVDRNEIVGSKGKLTFSTFGHEPIVLETAKGVVETFSFVAPPHIQQPLIQSIVNELLGLGGCCPSTGESAARTSRVMDEMTRGWNKRT